MATTRKTKAELIEIIEKKERDIEKLRDDIVKLENEKQQAAWELRDMFNSFMNTGFTEEQAMDILLAMIGGAAKPQKVSLF